MNGGARRAAPAVFLDRDGVLNEVVWRDGRPASPRRAQELELVRDVDVLDGLRSRGFRLFVVTNQPDVARGLLSLAALRTMMAHVAAAVRPQDMRWCVHDDGDGCHCRKPKPGMLLDLAESWTLNLASSYVVGDSWRDVQAGQAAGCRTLLLRRRYNAGTVADLEAGTLTEAVQRILDEGGEG